MSTHIKVLLFYTPSLASPTYPQEFKDGWDGCRVHPVGCVFLSRMFSNCSIKGLFAYLCTLQMVLINTGCFRPPIGPIPRTILGEFLGHSREFFNVLSTVLII